MKCGKGVIVPVSPQLKAPGTNCAQHPAETRPLLSKRGFTKEGPVSLQTASQAGEKRWFSLSVWHIYTWTHGREHSLWLEKLRYLSKALWAYLLDEHEKFTLGSCISISGTLLSQSQPLVFSFTGSHQCTEWRGGTRRDKLHP